MLFNKLFNKLIVITALCCGLTNTTMAGSVKNNQAREINELKKKIVKMQSVDGEVISINERYYKHKIAISQVQMIKKIAAYETYMFLANSGTRRDLSEINKMVDVAWECSWIFTDLGANHMERFKLILQWCKTETNFKAKSVSKWKKGQYIKSLNKYVKKDTEDYGPWQININNFTYSQDIYQLYSSGVVPFKIIRPRTYKDLFDIPTSCVVRCAIETDRKYAGLEWQHHKNIDKPYVAHISKKMKQLEREGLYDEAVVSKYYKLTPIKTYTRQR